jgi:hypothetical protein
MGSKKSAPAPAPAPAAQTAKKEWKRGTWKDGAYKSTSGTTFTKGGGGRAGANVMSTDTRNKVISQAAGQGAMMMVKKRKDGRKNTGVNKVAYGNSPEYHGSGGGGN